MNTSRRLFTDEEERMIAKVAAACGEPPPEFIHRVVMEAVLRVSGKGGMTR